MNDNQTQKLEKTISELDGMLFDGYIEKKKWWDSYGIESKKEGFDQQKYLDSCLNNLNSWYQRAIEILTQELTEKRHWFHFLEKKRAAISIPHPLGPLTLTFESYLQNLEDIIDKLHEEMNLKIRREIAELDNQADILYRITWSEHTREIKVNGLLLAKPDFNSENEICFGYLFDNPNRPVGIMELKEKNGGKLKKRLAHIVRDLGFVGSIKDVFFPVITKDKLIFINPISKQYAYKNSLPVIDIRKTGDRVRQGKVV